mmetsp:Transcript_13088/g.24088  ORF Transcript_13088/g.24088 Transcript_13088/m.24088 type:complete len:299 (-) Transcript_13088:134-1030(-)
MLLVWTLLQPLCCSRWRPRDDEEGVAVAGKVDVPELAQITDSSCLHSALKVHSEFDDASTEAGESRRGTPTGGEEQDLELQCRRPCQWKLGAAVERLLDDISNIWLGAEVIAVHDGDSYDICFVDDGSKEYDVEGCELRARKVRLEMPIEVWESVGSCLHDKQDLCTFQALARTPATASDRQACAWWCTSYHHRFGRCGPRCGFERIAGAEGAVMASRAVAACADAAAQGVSPADKVPWKARYVAQERLSDPRLLPEYTATLEPGDVFYGVSGKKVSYNSPLKGMFFDPRLGRMVREY